MSLRYSADFRRSRLVLMKMRKWLDSHFVCQIVKLIFLPRYKRSSEINQNLQFQMPTYVKKIPQETYWQAKILTEKDKKLVTDVLENPMVSLEKVREHFNPFSTKESISKQKVRKISRKHGIGSRAAAQKLLLKTRLTVKNEIDDKKGLSVTGRMWSLPAKLV